MKRLKVPIGKALAVLLALLVMLSNPVLPVSAEEIATPSDAVEWPAETDSEQDFPDEIPTEPSKSTMHPIQAAVDALGYAHVAVQGSITVYNTAALQEEAFTIHSGVLLVTAFIQQGSRNVLEVQFLTADGEAILAYADAADLPDMPVTEAEVFATMQSTAYALVPTLWDSAPAFQVDAEAVQVSTENSTVEMPDESDAPVPSDVVEISETPSAEVIADLNITTFHPGDFALVTTSTRVFLEPDETAYIGCFVSEAVVQVESAESNGWCKLRYLYGDDHANGTLKWTDTGTVYVLTSDLLPTDAQDCTVTDYADPYAVSALVADSFTLRSISMDLGSFAVGQTGLHGSSGKDSAYKQIATLPGRGKIYATPHYLEGYTVYCLEHLLPGPGENISGGGQQPTGPYMVVDLVSYMSTPGYSGVMYKESTMHAIGWVLRHTVPFMELDRSDSNNRTWSRVAGQFAIREVIKQLEGSQYVRDYWNMEDFYAASDNAPAVYLSYARWLAQGGIARAGVTGSITASNQQTSSANGMNFATVTLTTDADLMRISKTCGMLTGHTVGEDDAYYYLHSGDTVTLSASANTFGMTVESISSPEEEASFLVGVPDVAIQKVLIPQPGQPYPLKSLSLSFEAAKGAVRIIKTDAEDGAPLAGATFELVSNNAVIATATTGADGTLTFTDVPAGTYTLRETSAPEGYVLSVPTEQTVTVTSGQISEAAFTNRRSTAKIRIVKMDTLTGKALAGAEFTVMDAEGEIVATLTTDANGVAESDWLRYGVYTVTETMAPEHYINSGFSTVVGAFEDGKTYEFVVENEPAKGYIRLTKTDSLDGTPLSGVRFDIYDVSGEVVASMTTDEHGVAMSPPLLPGRYTACEYDTPDGYVCQVIQLNADVRPDETTDLTVTNKPIQGKIRIEKRDALTGERLADAEFTITNAAGEIVATLTTDTEGIAETDWLRYGVYTVTETKVPEHYVDSGFSCEVTINEEDMGTYLVDCDNEPTKGRIQLLKTDALDQRPIADVVFDIYRDGKLGSSMTTDENGVALSESLDKGEYQVWERNFPAGYTGELAVLDAVVKSDETTQLSCTNTPIQGKIRIEKRDTLTGERLAGAEFTITRVSGLPSHGGAGDGEVVAVITTDADGVAETPMLTYGVYRVAETKVPEHYVDSGFSCEVTINEEDMGTYLVDCDNVPIQGRILLDKKSLQLTDVQTATDDWGNEVHTPVYEEGYLAGAVFEIRAAEEIVGPDGTVWYHAGELADIITTTTIGGDASKVLPLGKYEVVEISVPAGYVCDGEPIAVALQSVDELTPVVEVCIMAQNDYLPAEITLFKEKEVIQTAVSGKNAIHSLLTTVPGEGFVFGLFTAQDFPCAGGTLTADTLVATAATDTNGMLTFSGCYPHGEYTIRELSAPHGWTISTERLNISISPEQAEENVIRVLLTEPIRNELIRTQVTLTKTDITGEKTLPGAMIEVYNGAGDLIYRDTTDERGEIASLPVTPGQYTFREVYAPNGYALNEAVMHFTVSVDGMVTGDTAIRDDFSRFSIEKVDESGKPLSGVVFCLVNADSSAVQSATTDRNGLATFENVPFGSYRVVETVVLAGYEPAEITLEVTIDGTFVNPEKPIATIVNVPNEVLVQKTDQYGEPLSGATFGLFDTFGERWAVATSDENGLVRFTKIPCGSYTLCELSAPDGYLISKEEIAFTIDADYHSTGKPIATVTNQRRQVQFIKVDTSGKALPGVQFALINAVTHEVVETAISNEQGEFIFTRFDYGDWIIRETAAPEGYSRMEDYLLHVDESWTEPEPIRLINIPSTYLFYKCDNRRNPLTGVTFAVEDEHGNVVQEVTSAENGVVTIEGLTPGKYTIRETATVEGFAVSGDTITVVIDENYTVPTKLKRFVNYPSIATGVEVSPTTLTWVGMGLIGSAGVVILLCILRKNHPAHRRK